jgi:ribonuclease D
MERAASDILKKSTISESTALGFDTETRPTYKKGEWYPTSLVQIVTVNSVYLFRISKLKRDKLSPLIPLLESPKFHKVGVSIGNDVWDLLQIQQFKPCAFYEVSAITKQCGYEQGGLRALEALLLHGRISKSRQMTRWDEGALSKDEVTYAATDAWAGLELYRIAMEQNRRASATREIDFQDLIRRKQARQEVREQCKKGPIREK